jgi:hypothetical protein
MGAWQLGGYSLGLCFVEIIDELMEKGFQNLVRK